MDIIEQLIADPPRVHTVGRGAVGLWKSETEIYRLLGRAVTEGTRTLETGAGLSTAIFAALKADHTCVMPDQDEATRIREYCEGHGIDPSCIRFIIESSLTALPKLAGESFDLFLLDGNHGFPAPIIDWFYGASLLGQSGVLVVDDLNLPAVRILADFLNQDQRWVNHNYKADWGAWSRLSTGSLEELHWLQPWYALPPRPADLPKRAVRVGRRVAGRIVHRGN